MTLACISVSKSSTSCISPQWQKNYPSGAQLSFPRKFLALKIVGKAQECDLSVTEHLIVVKPFRWLIPCCVLGCFEALPVCMLTLLAASPQPMQMFSSRHIQVCILLTRLYQGGFLAHCSHQIVFAFLTFTRSHLWESQLFPVSIPLWIPELPEAETAPFMKSRPLRIRISWQTPWCAVAQCSWLVLIWSWLLPAATKVPSFSWGPEP